MKKLMNKLLLSCLKSTELMEKKLHVKISWKEKLQLKMHTSLCSACSKYEKQNIMIDKILKEKNNMTDKKLIINMKEFQNKIRTKISEI